VTDERGDMLPLCSVVDNVLDAAEALPALRVTMRRPVIKRCPFKEELDAGDLTIIILGPAPELHELDQGIEVICATPVSHEDFTSRVLALLPVPGKAQVTTTWHTGTWNVEVNSQKE